MDVKNTHSVTKTEISVFGRQAVGANALARDPSASLEYWQKLAKTGKTFWFYNGRDRKKTGKMLRNCHFGLSGLAVSESWLRHWWALKDGDLQRRRSPSLAVKVLKAPGNGMSFYRTLLMNATLKETCNIDG